MLYKYSLLIFILINILLIDYIPVIKYLFNNKKNNFKNILIIGGSSGLGLALAINLQVRGFNITIASRHKEILILLCNIHKFNYIILDICNKLNFELKYDYIICTVGSATTGMFNNLKLKDYKKDIKLNYLGPINLLNIIKNNNKFNKPINILFISSTSTCIPIPGFIAYSPSKAALEEFIQISYLELKNINIFIKIFYSNTIKTKGFKIENINKPLLTKYIESFNKSNWSPDDRAESLINNINSKLSFSDKFTYLLKISKGVDSFIDLLFVFFGGIIRLISLNFIKRQFNRFNK